jgi:hypothetical protein
MAGPKEPHIEHTIWDDWHFIALAVIAILILVAHYGGLLDKLHVDVTHIALLFMIAFSGVFYVHSKNQNAYNRYISGEIATIKSGVSTHLLKDREDLFRTYNRLLTPRTKLYVTYYSQPPSPSKMLAEEAKYWKTIETHLSKNQDFSVSRIVTIETEEKFSWVKQLMERNKKYKQDNLKYRLAPRGHSRINVNIVDNGDRKYAVIHPSHGYIKDGMKYKFIDDTVISEYWYEFFLVAWSECAFLKDGMNTTFATKEFQKIEEYLRTAEK